jgi:hypothetical protein
MIIKQTLNGKEVTKEEVIKAFKGVTVGLNLKNKDEKETEK